jgi:hypothetical protein
MYQNKFLILLLKNLFSWRKPPREKTLSLNLIILEVKSSEWHGYFPSVNYPRQLHGQPYLVSSCENILEDFVMPFHLPGHCTGFEILVSGK